MKSEEMIQAIRAILTEPHKRVDVGSSISTPLSVYAFILTIIGLVITSFVSAQNQSIIASTEANREIAKADIPLLEAAVKASKTTSPGGMESAEDIARSKVLEDNLVNAKETVQNAEAKKEEALKKIADLGFRLYWDAVGVVVLALLTQLFILVLRVVMYERNCGGVDEAAFSIYDKIVSASNFKREFIEDYISDEAKRYLKKGKKQKIARIYYLFVDNDSRRDPSSGEASFIAVQLKF